MSYIVFARKYRPSNFSQVVAQEHVTRTLENSLKNDRIGSGYLFCGPRGTGKTTIARILAKAINCSDESTTTPCDKCSSCIEIAKSTALDVLEIDAASNTGVDDIRTLRENVRYLPTSGKKKIYIIDEVHRLSGSAFDALLKTLEEPPAHVMFIFATTEPLKVPETILSRTQRFDFKRVSAIDLANNLANIAKKENLSINDAALRLIARKADGSVRDSLSLLDQIAAFATGEVTELEVIEALGLVDRDLLFKFTDAVASGESKTSLSIIKEIFDAGVDPSDFIAEFLEHLRALLILTTDKTAGELLSLEKSELEDFQKQANYFSVGDIIRLMKTAADLNRDLKFSGLDERLLMEMTAVKMAQMEATVSFEEILKQIKENPQINTGSTSDLFNSTEKKKNSPTELQTEKLTDRLNSIDSKLNTKVNLPMVQSGWKNFLSLFHKSKPMLASQLGIVEIKDVRNNQIILIYPSSAENSKLIVEKSDNLHIITTALSEHFKAKVSIKFELDNSKTSPVDFISDEEHRKLELKRIMENSPRIKKLVEKVDGRVIGIKKRENS